MLNRIANRFYCEPWLLRPDVHASFGAVLSAHLRGELDAAAASSAVTKAQANLSPFETTVEQGHAFLQLSGVMGKHLSLMEMACAGGYDIALLERQLLELRMNDAVHTIIMSIDSPGGTATGIAEVAQLVREVAEEKRTIAFVDTQACSAAYWIASACDEIYGGQTCVVGSISAYIALIDESRAFEMAGLRLEYFRDGRMKGIGLPGKAMVEDERMYLQTRVDTIGKAFKEFVSARRPALAQGSMDGRWFSGEEGLEAGLLDGIYPTLSHMCASVLKLS